MEEKSISKKWHATAEQKFNGRVIANNWKEGLYWFAMSMNFFPARRQKLAGGGKRRWKSDITKGNGGTDIDD